MRTNRLPSDYLLVAEPEPETKPVWNELLYANLLAQQLPRLHTIGPEWFCYTGGCWRKGTRDEYRPKALEVIPWQLRTDRRAGSILNHIESQKQVSPELFGGFNREEKGCILLNLANGVLRVKPKGRPELLPHSSEYLFSGQLAATYDPKATAPLFERVMMEALTDPADQDLYQLCCGNFLLPDCRHEVALVCYGEAGTSKSTLAEAVTEVIGPDLIKRLSLSQLCNPNCYNLANLRHAAVNLATELDALDIEDSANFKTLVSGEPIEARQIYCPPFTMQTSCKLWFLANQLPQFKSGTQAELRRTRFIRFSNLPLKKDETLKAKLRKEREGVLNWLLLGLQRVWIADSIPWGGKQSRLVRERFMVSNDPIGKFVTERCSLGREHTVSKDTLFGEFKDFVATHGLSTRLEENNWFFRRLYERFPELKESKIRDGMNRKRLLRGIALQNSD